MFVNRLLISGFKSFAKKSVIDFGVSVTAIVGPNGSGKSNVAEAIRFVLGEQSLKSLRGKNGADLIFKGTREGTSLARASVELVFGNSDRRFSLSKDDGTEISLDFDEIVIRRVMFLDGTTECAVNDTPIRLKDLYALLGSVGLGAGSHHIIAQGEADKILSINQADRAQYVEATLGLSVFRQRLKEAERKLLKTKEHAREAEISRRELAPQMSFLKKQIEKIEKTENLRRELLSLAVPYFAIESAHLSEERVSLKEMNSAPMIKQEMRVHEEALEQILRNKEKNTGRENVDLEKEKNKLSLKKAEILEERDLLSRHLGRLEGEMAQFKRLSEKSFLNQKIGDQTLSLPIGATEELFAESFKIIDEINWRLQNHEFAEATKRLKNLRLNLANFQDHYWPKTSTKTENISNENDFDWQKLEREAEEIQVKITEINANFEQLNEQEEKLRLESLAIIESGASLERELYEHRANLATLSEKLKVATIKEEAILQEEGHFKELLTQVAHMVGGQVFAYKTHPLISGEAAVDIPTGRVDQQERRRQIDKMLLKLEDSGIANQGEIKKEYESVRERDAFLDRQLFDLRKAEENLLTLMRELSEYMNEAFRKGVVEVGKNFDDFFKTMFPSGKAQLILSEIEKEESEEEESGKSLISGFRKYGLQIAVNLPGKKITDLTLLSGGERALTAIAFLFAISQVNPPPFILLDETDAALDEANSKKYGLLIKKLSEHSKLIVITHNRETMSHAGVLYGITLDKDGSSRVLSVKLGQAEEYAK